MNRPSTKSRNTKLIVTIGPASKAKHYLKIMKDKGVDFLRINMSHSSIEDFVEVLKSKGITIVDEITDYEGIGKFVHILDIEGNKIELWEQPIDTTSLEK